MSRQDPIRRKLKLLDRLDAENASLQQLVISESPLFVTAIGLIAGIIMQHFFSPPTWLWLGLFAATIFACALVKLRYRPSSVKILAYSGLICFACVGALRLKLFYQPAGNDIQNFVTNERKLATIRGEVISDVRHGNNEGWKFSKFLWVKPGSSFYLKIKEVKTVDGWDDVRGVIRVQVSEKATGIEVGNYIQAYCVLDRFNDTPNPGQFDFKKYLNSKGVFVGASVRSSDGIEVLRTDGASYFAAGKKKLKHLAWKALLGDIHQDQQSGNPILAALILGQRSEIPTETNDAFRKTGLSHFISLSGMHLGILFGFAWWAGKVCGLLKRKRAVACFLLIVLYVLIVPPRAATLRAAIICCFFCMSVIVRRRSNPLNTLAFSAVVLLLVRPMDLFNIGWQLSYSTILGIVILYAVVEDFLFGITLDKLNKISFFQKTSTGLLALGFITAVLTLLAVGISAWAGGAGILLYHFGTITPLSCVLTVIVYPLVLAILMFGFIKIVLAAVLPTLGLVIGLFVSSLADALEAVVKIAAKIDISEITIGTVSPLIILGYYFVILFGRFGRTKTIMIKKTVCLGCLTLLGASLILNMNSKRNQFEMNCLSVGHGQAILISLPNGKNFLFDAGSLSMQNSGERIILGFLKSKGISKLDGIFISHDDIDHLNAVPEITAKCRTAGVYVNSAFIDIADSSSTARFLKQCLTEKTLELKLIEQMNFDNDATITPIWPNREICEDKTLSENNKSQVTLIEYASRKILLCSDIEKFAQQRILDENPDLKVDILVMPHHGSTLNLVEEFAEQLGAKNIVISCSKQRYASAYKTDNAINSFYTAIDGVITFNISSDGTLRTDCSLKRQD